MEIYQKLLENNREWVENCLREDPDYFNKLAQGQKPPVLWIGCADSRVPANQITGTPPGEVFVHRNISNMVIHTDMSMLSVLDYAVNVLEVRHVIVCGHYGCGGIRAAMSHTQFGLIDNWLRHIKDVYRIHYRELDKIKDETERLNRYVELNVIEQVHALAETSIIQNAWKNRQSPHIHGWVYSVANGIIKDLKVSLSNSAELREVYQLDSPQ